MSAVRFFAPEHPVLARTVRGKLEEQRRELVANLGGGYAQDFPDYKYRVGLIRGIEMAIKACLDAEDELRGE